MAFNSKERLKEVLKGFAGKRVLVIGDLMVDHYVETAAKKLSREAPIPVSDVVAEKSFAGGSSNLASNIVSLGGKAAVVGTVGKDYEGELLMEILAKEGIDTAGITTCTRPTSLKTRYFLDNRQHFRIDRETRTDIDKNLTDELLKSIESNTSKVDCVSISDYDKGTVTPRLINSTVKLAKKQNIPIYGQPKVNHYLDFIGFNCVKSNLREASKATGVSIMNESSLRNIGIHLLSKLECKSLVLTRGSNGLTVFEGNTMIHLPALTPSKEFRRAIGIRDAIMAVLALSLTAGANTLEASILSNITAAVSSLGATTLILSMKNFEEFLYEGKELQQPVSQVPLHR
ncbi:MAG: D-beta-D-heptose 7-phosphate kinase/D-beta-D-heptose 1-phosphate adenosyltransferase [Candidatus Nitrosomirales archaeon]